MPARPLELRTLRHTAPHDDIFAPIIEAATDKPFVIAQLGQSLDGRIATPSGASRWINGPAALDHLHRLRAHVDAVVVGVGTVAADDPLLTARRVALRTGRQPARVVIDPNGRLCSRSKCVASDGVRSLVVRSDDCDVADNIETIRLPSTDGRIDPASIADALFRLGFKKILIEGGAWTVSSFIDAGIVDRLHVLIAPIILGSGTTGLSLSPICGLDQSKKPLTKVHILDDGDVLFDCDLRTPVER